VGDDAWAGATYRDLGNAAVGIGDYARAANYYTKSLTLLRPLGERRNIGFTLYALGHLARLEGDSRRARIRLEEFLDLARETGNASTVAWALLELAKLNRADGQFDVADARLKASLPALMRSGNARLIADAILTFETVLLVCRRYERGVRLAGVIDRLASPVWHRVPADEEAVASGLAAARAALGEEEFERAWTAGHAMTLEQAVAYIMESATS
jgi:tetratricopeptide (TPR) repeat protein